MNVTGDQQVSGRCNAIFVGGLILILYTTLFPFDFKSDFNSSPLLLSVVGSFDLNLIRVDSLSDFPRNILLFLPFGFGLAHWLQNKALRGLRRVAIALSLGAGLSLSIEFLQTFLPHREPSLADVVANSIGTMIGLSSDSLWGNKILAPRAFLFIHGTRRASRTILAALYFVYVSVMLVIPGVIQRHVNLSNWDHNYPLTVGNEPTGDRPWQGIVSTIAIASIAIPQEEVACLLSQSCTTPTFTKSLVCSYQITEDLQVPDQAGNLPPLEWHGSGYSRGLERASRIATQRWLQTRVSASALVDKLSATSQFTLKITVTTGNREQDGPARIISLSDGPFSRNFTLGQQGDDLIVRLRTPVTGLNGAEPELIVPDVWQESLPQTLVVLFDGTHLQVYINEIEQINEFALVPEVVFFRYIIPVDAWTIEMNERSVWPYRIIYYAFTLGPAIFLFACRGDAQAVSKL